MIVYIPPLFFSPPFTPCGGHTHLKLKVYVFCLFYSTPRFYPTELSDRHPSHISTSPGQLHLLKLSRRGDLEIALHTFLFSVELGCKAGINGTKREKKQNKTN